MHAKLYAVNEAKNEFELGRVIVGVTPVMFASARTIARLDVDHDGDMVADLHDDNGDIIDVLIFSRQMRDRVVAELSTRN